MLHVDHRLPFKPCVLAHPTCRPHPWSHSPRTSAPASPTPYLIRPERLPPPRTPLTPYLTRLGRPTQDRTHFVPHPPRTPDPPRTVPSPDCTPSLTHPVPHPSRTSAPRPHPPCTSPAPDDRHHPGRAAPSPDARSRPDLTPPRTLDPSQNPSSGGLTRSRRSQPPWTPPSTLLRRTYGRPRQRSVHLLSLFFLTLPYYPLDESPVRLY